MIITEIKARKDAYEANFARIETVTLSWEDMQKRRLRVQTDKGRWVGLAFDEGGVLRDGDLLYADGDVGIVVRLAPEAVLTIYPRDTKQYGLICYELGNRHLPSWVSPDEILVLDDTVLREYLNNHGIRYEPQSRVVSEPKFTAEGGGVHHSHSH